MNQRTVVQVYDLALQSIFEGTTEAAGRHRVYLAARDLTDPGPTKTFICNRIIEIIDGLTGEITTSVSSYLDQVIQEAGGTPPKAWPREKIYIRPIEPIFGQDGFASGYFFGLKSCFADSLDVVSASMRDRGGQAVERLELQGSPVELSFRRGDQLYGPPHGLHEEWACWLVRGKLCIEVKSDTDADGFTEIYLR